MTAHRTTSRKAAWLALLAVLWAALVPTLAQAAAAGSGGRGWVEVCSTSGVVWTRVESTAQTPASEPAPMSGTTPACAWCLLQGAAGLPPAPTLGVLPLAEPVTVPAAVFESVMPVAVWSTAQSRAPPTI